MQQNKITLREILLGALILLTLQSSLIAEEKQAAEEDVDYLTLTALMIRDGHYDRAKALLRNIDVTMEGLDLGRYYTLSGLIELKETRYEAARDALQAAMKNGQTDSLVWLYLAQAHYGLQEYQETIDALNQSGNAGTELPGIYEMRAQCLWLLARQAEAIGVLHDAQRRFTNNSTFIRREIFWLVERGLYKEAADLSQKYLEETEPGPGEWLVIGEAFRRGRRYAEAQLILEMANLRFQTEEKITVALAHAYMGEGKLRAAARIFEELAVRDVKYLNEAVEINRRAGDVWRALFLNAQVTDQTLKTRQRLQIMLDQNRYEEAAALEPRLSRLGLLEDDRVKYAMAYVHFVRGGYDKADDYIKEIRDSRVFSDASVLLKAMEKRKKMSWEASY